MRCLDCDGQLKRIKNAWVCVDCGETVEADPRAKEARRLRDGFGLLGSDEDKDPATDRFIGRMED